MKTRTQSLAPMSFFFSCCAFFLAWTLLYTTGSEQAERYRGLPIVSGEELQNRVVKDGATVRISGRVVTASPEVILDTGFVASRRETKGSSQQDVNYRDRERDEAASHLPALAVMSGDDVTLTVAAGAYILWSPHKLRAEDRYGSRRVFHWGLKAGDEVGVSGRALVDAEGRVTLQRAEIIVGDATSFPAHMAKSAMAWRQLGRGALYLGLLLSLHWLIALRRWITRRRQGAPES